MGWWKAKDAGVVLGDEPFSIMRAAARAVYEAYEREFGRCPTREEWEVIMKDAVSTLIDFEGHEVAIIAGGGKPKVVKIVLESDPE